MSTRFQVPRCQMCRFTCHAALLFNRYPDMGINPYYLLLPISINDGYPSQSLLCKLWHDNQNILFPAISLGSHAMIACFSSLLQKIQCLPIKILYISLIDTYQIKVIDNLARKARTQQMRNFIYLDSFILILTCISDFKGPITIRRTAIPSMLVNFSTFAFLLNFSFMK